MVAKCGLAGLEVDQSDLLSLDSPPPELTGVIMLRGSGMSRGMSLLVVARCKYESHCERSMDQSVTKRQKSS